MIDGFILYFSSLLSRFTLYTRCLQTASLLHTFSDAAALLFQSTKRVLIDVKSIHVAANEMEEILQLLTEHDIKHTNHPNTLHPPDVHSSQLCQCVAVGLCLSLHYALSQHPHRLEKSF